MSAGPRILSVFFDRDAAFKAWTDHYRAQDPRSQVVWIGDQSPVYGKPWGVIAPRKERGG